MSDAFVRLLYQEGQFRRMPVTRLADELILRGLAGEIVADAGPDPSPLDPDGVIILMQDSA